MFDYNPDQVAAATDYLKSVGRWAEYQQKGITNTSNWWAIINFANEDMARHGQPTTATPFHPFLPVATKTTLGGVKQGLNTTIASDGTISAINGGQVQSDWNETNNTSPDYIKNKPAIASTSMPTASSLGITTGSDQTSVLNAAFLNSFYKGVIMDIQGGGAITISGTLNCQGKMLSFRPGTYLFGTATVTNFVLDTGLRQKCFDIGSSGVPSLTVNPIGTTLSVISPWAFGAKDDGTDISRALQCAVDCCIRNGSKVSKIIIPTGTYVCNNPIIEQNWSVSNTIFHQISIEGETNFSEADGYGTVLNFSARKNSFGIGIQRGKGSSIKNIKLIGGFNYTFPGAYAFYNLAYAAMTDGVSRDTGNSPNAAIVIDPFGTSIPADGGYPGNDAYGIALSTYYRGSGNQGSTGVVLEDIFFATWVVGIISSPNGQTANAELTTGWKLQFQNIKVCIASCQSQEKLNTFRHIENWGACYYTFATGLYGAASPGSYWVEDVNLAGYNNSFIYNIQQGYFPSFFSNIYAESLGKLGRISSNNGTTISKSTLNFADYISGTYQYTDGQITGQGVTFIGCQIRMFGTSTPITINALNGPVYFRDCGFDAVPFFNQDYPLGYCAFSNCTVAGTAFTLNPLDLQTISSASFSDTFAYGNIRVKIGSPIAQSRMYSIKSSVPAIRMPVNVAMTGYTVTVSLVGSYYQAVITCVSDELNRVFVGDIVCADTLGNGSGIKVIGIVSAAGAGTFTIKYIPSWVVSGNTYYLYIWLQLKNVSFTGNVTSGSNQITNVSLVDGDLVNFNSTGLWGGLIITKNFKSSDAFGFNMIRITGWNSGTSTLTVDKNSTQTKTRVIFINTDGQIELGLPDSGTLFTSISSVTVANSVAETTLIGTIAGNQTIPANFLFIGMAIRVRIRGIHSAVSNPTITIKIKFGSTIICTTGIVNSANSTNAFMEINADIICIGTGVSGSVNAQGYYKEAGSGFNEFPMVNTGAITIDTTSAQKIDVTVQWGTANASNTMTSFTGIVEILNY